MAKEAGNDRQVRLQKVKKWMLEGKSQADMMRLQKWGITLRTLQRYVESVRNEWREECDADVNDLRAKKIAELEERKRNLQAKYKTTPSGIAAMVQIDKLIIALMGLEKPVVRYITTPEDSPIQVSNTFDIDYSKLSPEALKEIVNARNKK